MSYWTIEVYQDEEGKAPFLDWLEELKDVKARAIVKKRLDRVRLGNFGDHKAIGGGINELRIDYGSGYRVYYGRNGETLVLGIPRQTYQ
jgi:putative addiction module killer protein